MYVYIYICTFDLGKFTKAWLTLDSNKWTSVKIILSSNFFNSLNKLVIKVNASLKFELSI